MHEIKLQNSLCLCFCEAKKRFVYKVDFPHPHSWQGRFQKGECKANVSTLYRRSQNPTRTSCMGCRGPMMMMGRFAFAYRSGQASQPGLCNLSGSASWSWYENRNGFARSPLPSHYHLSWAKVPIKGVPNGAWRVKEIEWFENAG